MLIYSQRSLQSFRKSAELVQEKDEALYVSLLRSVQSRMDRGNAKDCMSTRALIQSEGLSEREIAYAVSAPFGAGVDTARPYFIFVVMSM